MAIETARMILDEAHRVWSGIERGTHTASDLDEVLDPRRWSEPSDALVLATLNRYYVPDGTPARSVSEYSEGAVRAMRAILRGDFVEEDEE